MHADPRATTPPPSRHVADGDAQVPAAAAVRSPQAAELSPEQCAVIRAFVSACCGVRVDRKDAARLPQAARLRISGLRAVSGHDAAASPLATGATTLEAVWMMHSHAARSGLSFAHALKEVRDHFVAYRGIRQDTVLIAQTLCVRFLSAIAERGAPLDAEYRELCGPGTPPTLRYSIVWCMRQCFELAATLIESVPSQEDARLSTGYVLSQQDLDYANCRKLVLSVLGFDLNVSTPWDGLELFFRGVVPASDMRSYSDIAAVYKAAMTVLQKWLSSPLFGFAAPLPVAAMLLVNAFRHTLGDPSALAEEATMCRSALSAAQPAEPAPAAAADTS